MNFQLIASTPKIANLQMTEQLKVIKMLAEARAKAGQGNNVRVAANKRCQDELLGKLDFEVVQQFI